MSTEFNTAEELPVELPEAQPEVRDETLRREMQDRLQAYRERRGRAAAVGVEPAASRVIPFRRSRPSRTMEWAITGPDEEQPECIPAAASQPVTAANSAPLPAPAADEALPPIVPAAPVAEEPIAAKPAPAASAAPAARPRPSIPVESAPAPAPRSRPRPATPPAAVEVAEPVIRPRKRQVHAAPPIVRSEQNRIRIELNPCREVAEDDADLNLPQPAAPRSLRFNALVTDTFYVLAGSALFTAAALTRTGLPQQMPTYQAIKRLIPVFVGVPALLFAVYVLLSFSISNGTPGMKQVGLEVRSFSGKRPSRKALRRRGWAMVLSLAACGIGLLWANCDSDNLTLHDHISSTYLTVRRQPRPPRQRSAAVARKPAPGKAPRRPGQA